MPHNTNNPQVYTPPEDDSALWQSEGGPPSWWTNEESHLMPNRDGMHDHSEGIQLENTPSYRINSDQDRPEIATLNGIKTHVSRLSQQLEEYILRIETRDRSITREAATGGNGEANSETPRDEEASDIEAAERDRLVGLALIIHDMLNSLQSHPTREVERGGLQYPEPDA